MSDSSAAAGTSPTVRRSADERREQILGIAIEHFAVGGYRATSTKVIARQAGISQPYLFRLFRTKQELFLACDERACQTRFAAYRPMGVRTRRVRCIGTTSARASSRSAGTRPPSLSQRGRGNSPDRGSPTSALDDEEQSRPSPAGDCFAVVFRDRHEQRPPTRFGPAECGETRRRPSGHAIRIALSPAIWRVGHYV
jgi:AcrR family transcriptional regulator